MPFYYQPIFNDCDVGAYDTLDNTLTEIKLWLEECTGDFDNMKVKINIKKMTEAEFEALPEFTGY